MADLMLDEVRDIGIAAARRVIGDTFTGAEVGAELSWPDREAYLFTFRFPSEALLKVASHLVVEMMIAIIDSLGEKGDTRFPHVRLRSDGSWTTGHHAAAE